MAFWEMDWGNKVLAACQCKFIVFIYSIILYVIWILYLKKFRVTCLFLIEGFSLVCISCNCLWWKAVSCSLKNKFFLKFIFYTLVFDYLWQWCAGKKGHLPNKRYKWTQGPARWSVHHRKTWPITYLLSWAMWLYVGGIWLVVVTLGAGKFSAIFSLCKTYYILIIMKIYIVQW